MPLKPLFPLTAFSRPVLPLGPRVHLLVAVAVTAGCALGGEPPRTQPMPSLRVAVLRDAMPGTDHDAVARTIRLLRDRGMTVAVLSGADICDAGRLAAEQHDLFVVPNAEVYPGEGYAQLSRYVDEGGHLLTLGGPAFSRAAWRHRGAWVDRSSLEAKIAGTRPVRTLMAFDEVEGPAGWRRATNDRGQPGHLVRVQGGPAGTGMCLEYFSGNLCGWDTWYSPDQANAFPDGHELLCLAVRGDRQTPQMAIELVEQDGSRWIAALPLTPTWQSRALRPGQFRYWHDSPTGPRRGGPRDRVRPGRVKQINVGLSFTHTPRVAAGEHRFWIDDLGTAPDPVGDSVEPTGLVTPVIESVSPSYKVYEPTDVRTVRTAAGQSIVDVDVLANAPSPLVCAHPRPTGKGTGLNLPFRWVPLLEARDAGAVPRGVAGWMLIGVAPLVRGNVLSFGFRESELVRDEQLQRLVLASIRSLGGGVFFAEAGTDRRTYRVGDPVRIGFKVVSKAPRPERLVARVRVREGASGKVVLEENIDVEVSPYSVGSAATSWRHAVPGRDCVVRCDLLRSGKVIDSIAHEFSVLAEDSPRPDAFVSVQGGSFRLQGRNWYPVGVNYWPLYVAGMERGDYFAHWLRKQWYDGEAIDKELGMMAALGINLVSIQWKHGDELPNLLDYLRRCGRHGIKVNLFTVWTSPLGFKEAEFQRLATAGRLAENPHIFAYDIIWEPGNHLFHRDNRGRWDRDWAQWLTDRYGSLADAEKDWGMPVPRKDGQPTSPADKQLREDGVWRRMVAAYRRFMDDLMSRKWNDAVTTLRRIDPNHLVSFRQGNTLPHDFTLTATVKHIDFICPEGYSIPDSQAGYDAACFITRFVHFTTGGKPILWSEFGKSVWDSGAQRPNVRLMDIQAAYHERFYRMVLETGANGTVPWWWPGGYRVDERSDFGIVNPDGTPRPAARLIARYAPLIGAERAWPEPGAWYTFDRDAHPGGYWHAVFNDGARAYAAARRAGNQLGVKTDGTGTTSCDVPLVAVGNTPCTGSNPPKYLNAEFNDVRIRCDGGEWRRVIPGARLKVPKGVPVQAIVSVGNLQEAEWICPAAAGAKPGGVHVASAPGSPLKVRAPILANAAYLQDAATGVFLLTDGLDADAEAVLHMSADRRVTFGEKLRFTLVAE